MKKLLKMTLLALALTPAMALAQQQFSSPEQAASALAAAIGRHDESALTGLLGDSWQQFLPPEGIDPDAVARFQRDWKVSHRIVQQQNSFVVYSVFFANVPNRITGANLIVDRSFQFIGLRSVAGNSTSDRT